MIDMRAQELVNASLDGELDGTGQNELDALLQTSAEAREYLAEMHEFAAVMNKLPHLEPPPDLQQKILASVKLPPARSVSGLPGQRFFTLQRVAGFATSFAAGVLLAVGFYTTVEQAGVPQDLDQLVGTLADPERSTAATVSLATPQVSGKVALDRTQGLLLLDFRLDAAAPVEITLELAGQALEFRGFVRADPRSTLMPGVSERLRIASQGTTHFSLALAQLTAQQPPIRFEVLAGGEPAFTGTIDATQ